MTARATIESYYDALRTGEPLGPFFTRADEAGADATVKFGLSERLVGVDAIESGLAAQTETTDDWVVESSALRVTERDAHAWFSDDVFLAWTDADRGIRFEFDTRWSGTLERRTDAGEGEGPSSPWRFVGMHVSTADDF